MSILNIEYPPMDEVEMMGIMEMRRMYRFLPIPETQEQCDVINRLAARLQENGLMTLPIRMDRGLDGQETLGVAQEPFRGG